MEEFKKKFIEEAFENIEILEDTLLELEKDSNNKELIEKVFRAMHTLKGGGAMFGFEEVSSFTHELETIYDLVRNDQMTLSNQLFDITLQSIDHLKDLFSEDAESPRVKKNHHNLLQTILEIITDKDHEQIEEDSQTPVDKKTVALKSFFIHFTPIEHILDNGTNPLYIIDELATLGETKAFPIFHKIPPLEDINNELCYIEWTVLLVTSKDIHEIHDVFIFVEDKCQLEIQKLANDDIFKHNALIETIESEYKNFGTVTLHAIEDLLKIEISDNDIFSQSKQNKKTKNKNNSNTISSIRVASEKLDTLMNLVSELVTTQARLSLFSENSDLPELTSISESIQKLTKDLRDNAFSIVLIPIENMLTRFQRLIRDLSNELDKKVEFESIGAETELDKTIIEALSDPLMHIFRNCIDHGIESPEERTKLGKPEFGTITLKAYYSGANVYIQISDDGGGIDLEKIRNKGIQKNLISENQELSEKEILDLIFLPGFSTAATVTDVSGRGVGTDVVKKKISEIRGDVEVSTQLGQGTTFTIKLPLTLSIIDGLLVKIHDTHYVIPLSVIDRIEAIEHSRVINTYNNILAIEGQQIPFFAFRKEFGEPECEQDYEELIIVQYEDIKIGLVVDSVIGEYQAVLKPLGKHYKSQEIVSGATILGDGTIALVLDTNKAIKKYSNKNAVELDEIVTEQQL